MCEEAGPGLIVPDSPNNCFHTPTQSPKCVVEDIADHADHVLNNFWKDSPRGVPKQFTKQDIDSNCSTMTCACHSFENLRLDFGDRVQVVSIKGECAKLARGYGFLHCPLGTELVKGEVSVCVNKQKIIFVLFLPGVTVLIRIFHI